MNEYEAALRRTAALVAAVERELDAAKKDRNAAIKQARAANMTWRAIAAATDMSELGVRRAIGYRRPPT